jgi:hypothetical protein
LRSAGIETVAHQVQVSDVVHVHGALTHLSALYPDFDRWYWSKVVPGLTQGYRLIDTVMKNGKVVAVAISKKTDTERKLCTLWVAENAKGYGHGIRLITKACAWMETQTPLATISEEHIDELRPVAERLGWIETNKITSLYRHGRTEFIFNDKNGVHQ